MTRLPKGWRGKTGVRGVYVKAKTPYSVRRDYSGWWRGYGYDYDAGDKQITAAYHKATEAMDAVDRLIEEKRDAG